MSHFNCLVIHKKEQNIDELMAPYSEELMVKPYIRESKEKCYKKYLQARSNARNKPNSFFAKKQKEEADIIGMSFERFKRWYWGEGRIWDKEGNSCLITEVDWKKPIIIYAVVTPGGKWHSRGKMLYFGISDETEEEAKDWDLNFYDHFIKTHLNDKFFVTILDCHI